MDIYISVIWFWKFNGRKTFWLILFFLTQIFIIAKSLWISLSLGSFSLSLGFILVKTSRYAIIIFLFIFFTWFIAIYLLLINHGLKKLLRIIRLFKVIPQGTFGFWSRTWIMQFYLWFQIKFDLKLWLRILNLKIIYNLIIL